MLTGDPHPKSPKSPISRPCPSKGTRFWGSLSSQASHALFFLPVMLFSRQLGLHLPSQEGGFSVLLGEFGFVQVVRVSSPAAAEHTEPVSLRVPTTICSCYF